MVLTWIALLVFLVALVLSSAFAIQSAVGLFRTLGSSGRRVGHALEGVAASADEVARRMDALPGRMEELEAELDRLSRSRAQLSLVLERFAEVRRTVTGLRTLSVK